MWFVLLSHFYVPASEQALVTVVAYSPPGFLPSIIIANWGQQSHCSSIFHRVLITHALALSASKFVHKKKSQRIYTRKHHIYIRITSIARRTTHITCKNGISSCCAIRHEPLAYSVQLASEHRVQSMDHEETHAAGAASS